MNCDISNTESSKNFYSRDMLLKVNTELINHMQKRISGNRFKVQAGDSIKLGYVRALLQALNTCNAILKDSEIEDLKSEIEELRELIKYQSSN